MDRIPGQNLAEADLFRQYTDVKPYDDRGEQIDHRAISALEYPSIETELTGGMMFEMGDTRIPDSPVRTRYAAIAFPPDSPISFSVHSTPSSDRPRSGFVTPRRAVLRDRDAVAAINAGFFFLADESHGRPHEMALNLCVRDGHPTSLPVKDSPTVIVRGGQLEVAEMEASGLLGIGGKAIHWVGALSESTGGYATLYGNGSITIEHREHPTRRVHRVVNESLNTTPRADNRTDIVLGAQQGHWSILSINPGGGTDFFEGANILQLASSQAQELHAGMAVSIDSVGGYDMHEIDSAATIGPSVFDFTNAPDEQHPITKDFSLGTDTAYARTSEKARAIICRQEGQWRWIVFDAVPGSDDLPGLTPFQLRQLLDSWGITEAYHLDSGKSVRLQVRHPHIHEREPIPFGNHGYRRFTPDTDLWIGRNGRPVATVLVASAR